MYILYTPIRGSPPRPDGRSGVGRGGFGENHLQRKRTGLLPDNGQCYKPTIWAPRAPLLAVLVSTCHHTRPSAHIASSLPTNMSVVGRLIIRVGANKPRLACRTVWGRLLKAIVCMTDMFVNHSPRVTAGNKGDGPGSTCPGGKSDGT